MVCSSFAVGGAENMVAQLLVGIKEKADVVAILSNQKCDNHIQEIVDSSNVKSYYPNVDEKKSIIKYIKILRHVHKTLKKEKPDIIHSHLGAMIFAVPYVLTHKVRYIHTVHNVPNQDSGWFIRTIIRLLVKLKKIEFSSISQVIQDQIVEEYKTTPDKARVIVNPVDCQKYECKRNNTYNNQNNQKIQLISIGRLSKQKNHKNLLKAFSIVHKENPNITLLVVGDGNLRQDLEKYKDELKLTDNVVFTGAREDIPKLLADSDIFVMSSDYEGLPLTMLEAMASGLPIISTDVGGIKDIVDEKNSILVRAGDSERLAEAITDLVKNHEKRNNMGVYSKEYALRYDVNIFISKYLELYGIK